MSAPVDVLAVMARDAELALNWNGRAKPESQKAFLESKEARAAVAELVEADREYDAAREALDKARNTDRATESWNELVRATNRRATALAKFGEG